MTFIKTAARLVLLASCGASTPSYSHSYVTRLRHRNVITQYIVFAVRARTGVRHYYCTGCTAVISPPVERKARRSTRCGTTVPSGGAAYGPAPLPPTCAAWRKGERARDAARWDAPAGVTSMTWARGGAEWRSRRAARQTDGGKVCEPAGREEGARFWQRGGGARARATWSERTIGRRGGLRGGRSAVGLHSGGGGGTWTIPPLPRVTASTAGLRQRRGHVGGGLRGSCGAVGLHGGGGGGTWTTPPLL
jgi:hypothetical protein